MLLKLLARIVFPLVLAFLGTIGLVHGSTLWGLILWGVALVLATGLEVDRYRETRARERKADRLREAIETFMDRAERIEYEVRDDPDNAASFALHRDRMIEWRRDARAFLDQELPRTGAGERFENADGEYNVGPLRFELTRTRRQRENLAAILDSLEAYVERTERGRPSQ